MKLHLQVPPRSEPAAPLPAFITDVRPAGAGALPRQVARTAELAGLAGVAVEFDPQGLDSLVLAAGLLRETRALQVATSLHPAVGSPVYAAKVAASIQRFTGSRLAWHLTLELDPQLARAQGDFLEGDARYARAAEFLGVARRVFDEQDVEFEGEFYAVAGGGLPASPRSPRAFPRVYTSGTSKQALRFAAAHSDLHLLTATDDPADLPYGLDWGVELELAEIRHLPEYASRGASEAFVTAPDPLAAAFQLAELNL